MPPVIQVAHREVGGGGEVDVHARAGPLAARIADGHAGLTVRSGLGHAPVVLDDVEQKHAVDHVAAGHAADVIHRVLAAEQQHVVAGVLRLPCRVQEVGVVLRLVDIAADRLADGQNLVADATHLLGGGVRRVLQLPDGLAHLGGGLLRDRALAGQHIGDRADRHPGSVSHVLDSSHHRLLSFASSRPSSVDTCSAPCFAVQARMGYFRWFSNRLTSLSKRFVKLDYCGPRRFCQPRDTPGCGYSTDGYRKNRTLNATQRTVFTKR